MIEFVINSLVKVQGKRGYRMHVKTIIPQLGFGCMRLPYQEDRIDMVKSKEMIDEYMKGEFCYFDTHPQYMGGKSENIIRELIVERYSRETFLLADKMPIFVKKEEDYEDFFGKSLEACGVSYFDYFLLHAMTREVFERHERLGGFDFLRRIKKEGRAKRIGFSFHDKPELLDEILTKHPDMDFVQLQINYLDWDSPVILSKECYEVARKHNKPILVMEPIKGGSLANQIEALKEREDLQNVDLAEIALKFVASLPGIEVVLSGMSEPEHVLQNRQTLPGTSIVLNEYEKEVIEYLRQGIKQENKIQCTACKYCEHECPKNIPVPSILSLLNACERIGQHDRTYIGRYRIFYNGYVFGKGAASDCIKCGKCEKYCPQKLPIRQYMEKAADLFEPPKTISEREKLIHNYNTVRDWMAVVQSGRTLEEYFVENGYQKIAVYGIGEIGTLLLKEMMRYEKIAVKYGIDRNTANRNINISIVSPQADFEQVDVIVVTPTFDFDNIKQKLVQKVNCPIVSLDEVTHWFGL